MSSRITRFLGSEKPIDHYELKVRKPGGTGWANPTNAFRNFETELENTDDLDEPLDREVVENTAESEGWPPGNYAMEAKGPDGSVVGYDWNDLHIEPDEDETAEDLDPVEALRRDFQELRAEVADGTGRISEPGEAYGRVFEAMMSGQEMPAENITALRTFLKEWQSVEQGPPSEPGEFAGRLAQQRFESGDTEGAVRLLDGWFQAEQPADAGGLLAKALDGNVDLGGEVGLLELAGIDAYTRMEPALDKIADSLGGQAVDAVAGEDTDNLLAKALAEGSGRTGDGKPSEPAAEPEPEPESPDDDGPSHSPDDVAEISAGFGSDTSSSTSVDVDDQDEPADALEPESVMGPTISTDEAADVAAQVGGGS